MLVVMGAGGGEDFKTIMELIKSGEKINMITELTNKSKVIIVPSARKRR